MERFDYSLSSDLHMDHAHAHRLSVMDWERRILIAGNLGNGLGNFKFVEKLARKGHQVLACDGNHEHYANKRAGRSIRETEDRFYEMMAAAATMQKPTQPRALRIRDGLYLIIVNGWYQVADAGHWKNYMSDGELVGCASEVNDAAKRHAEYVAEQLSKMDEGSKAIVVTHTAPCEASLDPKYLGSDGNQYYWNPMMEQVMAFNAERILRWHHGHTHAAVNVVRHGVPIITNPRGYPRENPEWRPLPQTA